MFLALVSLDVEAGGVKGVVHLQKAEDLTQYGSPVSTQLCLINHQYPLLVELAEIELHLQSIQARADKRQAGIGEVVERLLERSALTLRGYKMIVMRQSARNRIPDEINELGVRHTLLDPLRYTLTKRVFGVVGRRLTTHIECGIKESFVLV